MKWRRLGEELRGLVVRRHLREVHFSYGTVSLQDVLGVYASGVSSLAPRRGRASSDAKKFERAFAQQLGLPAAFSFGSGRMALYAILRSLGIGPGSEVLVPSFTCVVVPAAVVYAGATPRYVDIERATLNMDVRQLERQVTPRCRAVIAQHTFGRPADMDQILAFAEKHHLFVIEDCAHTIGGAYGDEPLGTIGDAAFFSLELTKPLTSVKGGVAVSRHGWLCERLQMEWSNAPEPSPLETARLWSQLAVYWALYHPNGYWLGKLLLMLLFKSGLYQFSITEAERR